MSHAAPVQTNELNFTSLRTHPIPAEGKTTEVLFETKSGRVIIVALAAGYAWQQHATPNHALVQLLTGECEFLFENKSQTLREGALLSMAPGLPHAVKAVQGCLLLLTLFKPEAA